MTENKTARLLVMFIGEKAEEDCQETPEEFLKKAEEYIKTQGFDFSTWGPEVEFFVFDKVHWDVLTPYKGQSYSIESKEDHGVKKVMDTQWGFKKDTIQVPHQIH